MSSDISKTTVNLQKHFFLFTSGLVLSISHDYLSTFLNGSIGISKLCRSSHWLGYNMLTVHYLSTQWSIFIYIRHKIIKLCNNEGFYFFTKNLRYSYWRQYRIFIRRWNASLNATSIKHLYCVIKMKFTCILVS